MSNPEVLFAAAVAAVALVAVLAAQAYTARLRAAARDRLSGLSAVDSVIIRPDRRGAPQGFFARADAAFEQAVGRTGMDVSAAGTLAFIALCGITVGGIVHFWKDNFLLTAVGALGGMAVPLAGVAVLQSRYRRRIQEQLPDALYALARSLRAGLNLEQALDAYARQGTKPLKDEFARVVGQTRLGLDVPVALETVSARVRLLDFNVFASTVALYRQTGGNLALLIDRMASTVRERNLYRGRFAAATAQGRVVAGLLALFGPAMLLGYAIWEPDHIRAFFDSPTGWAILLGCLGLELIGAIWMWNILKVDY